MHLALASYDKTLSVWDMEVDHLFTFPIKYPEGVCSVAYSRDGRYLASSTTNQGAMVHDAMTGELLCTVPTTANLRVMAIDFSSDGTAVIIGGYDGDVEQWRWKR